MKATVIGSPITHSLSPRIFAFLSKRLGRKLAYSAVEVRPEEWDESMAILMQDPQWIGTNVTIPLKELAFQKAHTRARATLPIQAANVLVRRGDRLEAFNTDVIGIRRVLQATKARTAVIDGTGGSARSAVIALHEAGFKSIGVRSRSKERAREFCRSFAEVSNLEPVGDATSPPELWINATPAGMNGQEAAKIPSALESNIRFVFDFVYRPHPTALVSDWRKRGVPAVTGLSMLVWQALATWEIWFAEKIATPALHDEVHAYLEKILNEVPA